MKMATATMTKKVVKDKEVEAIIKNVQENKKKQDIKTPYKYTSAKELEKLFNLKNKQKYPILFTKVNGMEVAKERKNGESAQKEQVVTKKGERFFRRYNENTRN